MRSVLLSATAALAALLLTPGSIEAHTGGESYVLVLADHVNPGESFEVVVADLSPDADIDLVITRDQLSVPLSTVRTGADGHFQTTLQLPADFPEGYAQLFASEANGDSVSTWVLVGQRTATTPPPPNQPAWWADPSILILLVFVIGALAVVGYLVLRPRRQSLAPAGTTMRRVSKKGRR